MKKLLTVFALACSLMAEVKVIDKDHVAGTHVISICVDGYKYLVVKDDKGIALVQVYEARSGSKPARPIECN